MDSKNWVHDVFLCFRGVDTRNNFTSHLYMALNRAGFVTFKDDEELRKGEDISASLKLAIQQSRTSVIVISEKYADSRWCLNELVQIMKCRDTLQQLVVPVFYHVHPSDVRKQTGSFGAAFQKHKATKHVGTDRISRWRAALTEAADVAGWYIKTDGDRSEADYIKYIVDKISRHLNNTYLHVATYPVGIHSRVQEIGNSLSVGLHDDVRMVGIWGMGGSGKTSLAKAIYNKFYHDFEGTSFLANVRETANKSSGMINLQERLLSDILNPTKVEVGDANRGIIVIQERLQSKKVLVIVDDVDEVDQLSALALRHSSFGPGSRIIITTRDRHLLEILKVDTIHPTLEMTEEESLELFSWHAFQNPCPDAEFLQLSRSVCTYCGGLPLALEVLGSFLFKGSIKEWESTLKKLEECPNDKIQKILRISYDALDRIQKVIFLHISCFFIGMDKNYVTKILQGCGFFPEKDISVLLQRCLVIVSEKSKLMMHDLLRDMGREVVRAESYNDPEERSRLWYRKDVIDVLTEESGTKKIEGLVLNLQRSEKLSFRTKAFTKMKKLKLLQLNYVKLTGDYDHLSKKLSWLCWHGLSLKFIGNDFLYQGNLVSMDLQYSNLVQVWEHPRLLEKLKILNLSHSHYLAQSPDFSKLPNLEYLIMKDCRSLSKIHPSIGDAKRLALVNLKDCQKLKDLPRSFYTLKFLETLVLTGCSRFENLVEDTGEMTSLTTLFVGGTAIRQVPFDIGRLNNLNYSSVQSLVRQKLYFPEVPKNYFPAQDYTSSTFLNRQSSSVHNLPELSGLSHLERPCFNNSTNLPASEDLPTRSKELELDHCTAVEMIPYSSEMPRQRIVQVLSNLPASEDLPTRSKELESDHFTALEIIPYASEMLRQSILQVLSNLPASGDFPCGSKELESGHCTEVEIIPYSSEMSRQSILQGWTASGDGGICLCANDFPEPFAYFSEGDRVLFQVPQIIGCNIKAFTVCVVCSSCFDENISPSGISISVTNQTKDIWFTVQPTHLTEITSHEVIWRVNLLNKEFNLEGDDSVEVAVVIGSDFRVKKTGVSLVWDPKLINENTIVCEPIPYEYFTSDADKEAGPSHISSDEDRPSKRLRSVTQEQPMHESANTPSQQRLMGENKTPSNRKDFVFQVKIRELVENES